MESTAAIRVEEINNSDDAPSTSLPFLKWPGGKRWLAPKIINIIGEFKFETYREPFLGGGALFFALRPRCSVLSDINKDLINTYSQVKNKHVLLTKLLKALPVNREVYDYLRSSAPDSPIESAVRFLYLNRTSFGGMYRLNQRGEFNVPFGGGERTTAALWRNNLLQSSAEALSRTTLLSEDFEVAISRAGRGDLVYCDPTYTVTHNKNGFIRYNEKNFSWDDQKRLAQCCRAAAARGALVIVSNACHGDVLDLYSPPRHYTVARTSRLCPDVAHRRSVDEYLFVFPPNDMVGDARPGQRGIDEE